MSPYVASIIIPIALYHQDIAQQAIASARAQSVPTEVIELVDTERRGAGYMRNRGVEKVTTPFVVFLDADDAIEPSFVEKTLAIYEQGYYCYTDWIANGKLYRAPDCSPTSVWQTGAMHMITCLIPTAFHRAAGGFDEGLSGFEDTAYFVKLHTLGFCGLRCPEPLLHYRSKLGKRSHDFERSGQYEAVNAELVKRYGRYKDVECGCGTGNAPVQAVVSAPQPGMVLAEAQYAPARKMGFATQTYYPRVGFGERLWVWPADVERSPRLWTVVSRPYEISPAVDEIMAMVNA